MLEIRGITKVYHSKTGEAVKALDGISVQFPETGMVFLLGKSGSGKSTLLNVIGGLDSYDSGEFVIKGKSSKDFVGSDFDAYRNTFIGFIFQEYNVLDDFTVGANIGLALELQGKKATPQAISSILEKVDLAGYAARKPNELSGGQKQRVAIARALVKDPQIIMADEPTGALDSTTGKQIFDTLKELSREKLVLVVSHDRDFAEKYADRIIELSDGRVIEDVTKHARESERLSDGVHRVNDHILRIEGGYQLTAKDLEMINAYLAKNHGDVLLSGDDRVNDELCTAVGISKDGHSTIFEGTVPERDVKTRTYEKKESRFIRSRLPMKNAVKIGASGLKHKKFRLFMTILLSFLSFAMFGLASTVAVYESVSAATQSMIDSNVRNASITVTVRHTTTYGDGDVNHWYAEAGINEQDIAYLNEQTGLNFVPVYTGSSYAYGGGFQVSNQMPQYEGTYAYNGRITGFVNLAEEEFHKTGYALTGSYPQADNEVVISELLFRQFQEYGYTDGTVTIQKGKLTMDDNAATGIIGKTILLSGNGYWKDMIQIGGMLTNGIALKIVGVADTGFDYGRYQAFLPQDQNNMSMNEGSAIVDYVLQNELSYEINFGFHALGFTTKNTIETICANNASHYIEVGTHMSGWGADMRLILSKEMNSGGKDGDSHVSTNEFWRVAGFSSIGSLGGLDKVQWLDGRTSGVLAENEILLPSQYKGFLSLDSAQITFSEEHLASLVALFGEDVWAQTNSTSSFYERALQAASILYMQDALNSMEGLREHIELQKKDGDFTGDALAYWKYMWFECKEEGFPWYHHGEESTLYMWEVGNRYFTSDAFVGFVEEILNVDIPNEQTGMDPMIELANTLLGNFYAEDLIYSVEAYALYYPLKRIYVESELNTHKPWKNEKMIDLLIDAEYDGIDSRVAWNALDEGEQEWRMRSFYEGWYCSDQRFSSYHDMDGYIKPAYTDTEYYELGREMLMSFAGLTQQDVLEMIKVSLVERSYETDSTKTLDMGELKIAGFFDSTQHGDLFICDKVYNYYLEWYEAQVEANGGTSYKEDVAEHENGIWAFAVAPMPDDSALVEKLAAMHYAEKGTVDLRYRLNNAVMSTLDSFDELIEIIAQVFLWVGLGLAVFASFLLMNFIATSISYKKREIGILRAVGAKSSDVFKIFFSEAFIIAMINFALAFAACLTTVILLNNYMRTQGINITLLSFGLLQTATMLAISVFVAAVASFLPVYGIARKKPVDAIKDR